MGRPWPLPGDGDGPLAGGPTERTGAAEAALALLALRHATAAERRLIGGVVLSGSSFLAEAWIADAAPSLGPAVAVPGHADREAILGGLDLDAVIATGRTMRRPGLLDRARGGSLILRDSSNLDRSAIGAIADAIDVDPAPPFLFVVEHDEAVPAPIAERAGIRLDLSRVRHVPTSMADSDDKLGPVAAIHELADPLIEGIATALARADRHSARSQLAAVSLAKALARSRGKRSVAPRDAIDAVRLVLGLPAADDDPSSAPDDTVERDHDHAGDDGGPRDETSETSQLQGQSQAQPPEVLPEQVIEELLAAFPPDVLAALNEREGRKQPRAPRGSRSVRGRGSVPSPRGRRRGTTPRPTRATDRPALVPTLRAAIALQTLRGRLPGEPLRVRPSDLHYATRRSRRGTTIVFAVDMSGSAATERLGEAKGAVARLLGEAYARRDRVAVVTFRDASAELVVPPTRGLTRARRALAGVAAGGGTPLAAGMVALACTARAALDRGERVVAVLLTDGRGNVARDGRMGRGVAREDERAVAAMLRELPATMLVVDIGRRAGRHAASLAAELNGRHVVLPRNGGRSLAAAIVGDGVGASS